MGIFKIAPIKKCLSYFKLLAQLGANGYATLSIDANQLG